MNVPLVAGLALLAALWLGPLPAMSAASFSAHMTLHMGVVAVAAPLLAAGLGRSRFDPVRKAPALFAPIPASLIELVIVWAWHTPVLHHAARHDGRVMAVEQAAFLASGLLLWLAAWGTAPERRAAGVIALLLTSMHMTLLGALLALTPRALFHHAGGPLPPLIDQHLGGAIMLVVGGAAYLIGGLWLTLRLLHQQRVLRSEP